MLTPPADDLRAALTALMRASATRDAAQIRAARKRLDELSATHAEHWPAPLRHYLDQRSYQKALEYLQRR
jgi:hypothetical protein